MFDPARALPPVTVESRDRLGPGLLPTRCAYRFERDTRIGCGHHVLDHLTAVIDLPDHVVSFPLTKSTRHSCAPAVRRHVTGPILQDVSPAVYSVADDYNPGVVCLLA